MSFLAPLFLIGAVAVAAPIIFHLIRRTVKERVRFSTLMFLKESPPKLTKRSHLEHWLLLLLRCAVICLLAISFARPYLQHAATEPPKAASGKRIVVLLDTSASMRRQGAFEAAKRQAAAAIRRAEPDDSVAVVAFDVIPRTSLSFDDWKSAGPDRVATAISRVETAQPTWNSTHLGRALTAAAEMILDAGRADAEGTSRSQIIVVSDLQQGAKLDGLQGFDWPRACEVVLDPVTIGTANAGIQLLTAAPGESLSVTNSKIRARVVNAAGSKTEQFKIGWAAPDATTFTGPPLELHVPSGQGRSIALPTPPTNAPQLSALILGDAENFDNRAYHAAPPRQTLRVTFIGPDAEDNPNAQLFYVRRAFPETAGISVKVDSRKPGEGKPVDSSLVITTTLASQDTAEFKKHLSEGKTILLVPAAKADLSALATLTEGAAPAVTEATGNYVILAEINFEHPLFIQFRDARFNDFTKIHFWKHRVVDLTALPKARALATFDDKSPALAEIPVPKGALFLLTAGWNPSDSQFALSTKFVPFLYSLLELSSPASAQARHLTVGDSAPFPPDFPGAAINLRKPDGATLEWKKGQPLLADQPGFYTAAEPPLLFAANLDPNESRTTPVAEEQLSSLGLPLKIDAPVVSAEVKKQREQLLLATEQESRQKLWRRLLVFALAFLLLESVLARLFASRPQVATA